MDQERWQRVKEIFSQVVAADSNQQTTLLEELCGKDRQLKWEVRSLIANDLSNDEAFMESPRAEWQLPLSQPDRVGPYRVVRLLGQGGMGSVFEATRADDEFQQQVAIKLMHFGLDTPALKKRFEHERQIMATLNHPNVARLLDGGTTVEGSPYFVLEFIEGRTITAFCVANRSTPKERIGLFLQVCQAVSYAHRNLIVHRDIKPANILVSNDGQVKLLDFGIAKLLGEEMSVFAQKTLVRTRTGQAMMTPQYASPEQYLNQPVTTATDVYGLGLLLYELLTGVPAYDFSDKSMIEIDRMIVHDSPLPPSAAFADTGTTKRTDPVVRERAMTHAKSCATTAEKLHIALRGELDHIIMKALRKEPERRYPTVDAFSADLHAYLEGRPVSAHADSLWYRSRKFIRRNARAVAVLTSFLVVLSLLTCVSLRFAFITGQQSKTIVAERDRAEEVSHFLVEIFESADPFVESSGNLTVGEILRRSAGRIDTEFKERPRLQARLLALMGRVYTATGEYKKGQDFLDRALSVAQANPDATGEERAEIFAQYGENLRIQGQWKHAQAYYQTALQELTESAAPVHLRAEVVFQDATNFLENRQFDQALQSMERAERLVDSASVNTDALKAKILNIRARAYQEMNDFDRAEVFQRRAVDMADLAFGTHHAHTGEMRANLAIILDALGRSEEAREVFDQALTVLQEIFGTQHPLIATLYNNLGMMLENQGKNREALEAHQKALDIRMEVFGEDNAYVIMSLINMGFTLDSMGEYSDAETLYRRAISVGERVLEAQHPDLGFLYNNYCYNLQAQEKWVAAEDACHTALEIYRAAPGHEVAAGQTAALLGKVMVQARHFKQAIPILQEAVKVGSQSNGQDLIPVGRVLNNLGHAHFAQGDWASAKESFGKAHQVNLEEKGFDHPDTLASKAGLDKVLAVLGASKKPSANRP